MIKLHASYSKKIPAESQYSSKSFHASLEIEVADDLAQDPATLQTRLRTLWSDLETAVEAQISGANGNGSSSPQAGPSKAPPSNGSERASQKQISYLMLLSRRARDWSLPDLQAHVKQRFGTTGIYELSKSDASTLIEELKAEQPQGSSRR